jgi:hypothetical protein
MPGWCETSFAVSWDRLVCIMCIKFMDYDHVLRMLSPGMQYCIFWYKFGDGLEECVAST